MYVQQEPSQSNFSDWPAPTCTIVMIPPTITATPNTSADSSELEDSTPTPVTPQKPCANKDGLSRAKFNFSFDSENPVPRKSSKGSSSRRQAASHRRFATPILRASHTSTSRKPKFYSGIAPVSESPSGSQNKGLTIDTAACRRRSIADENDDQPIKALANENNQVYNCIDSIGSETGDIITGLVSHLGGLKLR